MAFPMIFCKQKKAMLICPSRLKKAQPKLIFMLCFQGALEKLENNPLQYEVDSIPNFNAEGIEFSE